MREKFCVKKKTLLLIAGIVWLMGGGIGFRAAGIFPDIFVAFFYSGVGCALALPEVCTVVGSAVPEIMREIAEAMGLPLTGRESGEELGHMCAERCRELMREMKIPSLKEQGFDREKMAEVAKETETSHLSDFCPVKITHELAQKIAFGVYDNYQ